MLNKSVVSSLNKIIDEAEAEQAKISAGAGPDAIYGLNRSRASCSAAILSAMESARASMPSGTKAQLRDRMADGGWRGD